MHKINICYFNVYMCANRSKKKRVEEKRKNVFEEDMKKCLAVSLPKKF